MVKPTKSGLPKLPSGITDWQSVFEDPEKGLLSRLAKITTISALRRSVTMVINRLYTRKDDAIIRKQHLSTLSELIPESTSENQLEDLKIVINDFLLEIETERIQRAEAYALSKETDKSFDHQAVAEVAPPVIPERRLPVKKQKLHVPVEEKSNYKVISWIGTFALLALVAFGGYKLLDTSGEEQLPVKQFVEQMTDAAAGDVADQHIYGGKLKTGKTGGRLFVTADHIPSAACASAAWVLVNRGITVINRVTPSHISPSGLKKLCTLNGRHAVITWYPKKTPDDQ